MATRKLPQRSRRQNVQTLAEYTIASPDFLRGISTLPTGWWPAMLDWHIERFASEDHGREFYESNRDILNTVATPGNWRDENYRHFRQPGQRSFLWWWFDSLVAYDENAREYPQLKEMGALTADEITLLRAKAEAEDEALHFAPQHNGRPFRRSWQWWEFIASEIRDETVCEAAQLTRLRVLTKLERAILDEPERATGERRPLLNPRQTTFYYLPPAERELLGLTYGHDEDVDRILYTPPALCGQ